MIKVVVGMVRIARGCKVPLMTRIAISRRAGIAGGMTANARQRCVGAGQCKFGLAVIEC